MRTDDVLGRRVEQRRYQRKQFRERQLARIPHHSIPLQSFCAYQGHPLVMLYLTNQAWFDLEISYTLIYRFCDGRQCENKFRRKKSDSQPTKCLFLSLHEREAESKSRINLKTVQERVVQTNAISESSLRRIVKKQCSQSITLVLNNCQNY